MQQNLFLSAATASLYIIFSALEIFRITLNAVPLKCAFGRYKRCLLLHPATSAFSSNNSIQPSKVSWLWDPPHQSFGTREGDFGHSWPLPSYLFVPQANVSQTASIHPRQTSYWTAHAQQSHLLSCFQDVHLQPRCITSRLLKNKVTATLLDLTLRSTLSYARSTHSYDHLPVSRLVCSFSCLFSATRLSFYSLKQHTSISWWLLKHSSNFLQRSLSSLSLATSASSATL